MNIANKPTGWVHLKEPNCTIRWQRGDSEAVVVRGQRVGEWTLEGLIGKIPVSLKGWTDVTDIRQTAERWIRTR